MKKNFIISILITTVVIIAIIFVYTTNKKPSEVTPAKEVLTEISEKIEGWQTYRNEELGFEVQYPEGWFVKDYQENNPKNPPLIGFDPWGSNPGGSVWGAVRYNRTEQTITEQLDSLISNNESDIERNDITLNTYSAIEIITFREHSNVIATSIFIPHRIYIYRIFLEDYSQVSSEDASWPYNERIDILKQFGNEDFEIFLNSFHFTD